MSENAPNEAKSSEPITACRDMERKELIYEILLKSEIMFRKSKERGEDYVLFMSSAVRFVSSEKIKVGDVVMLIHSMKSAGLIKLELATTVSTGEQEYYIREITPAGMEYLEKEREIRRKQREESKTSR